jgi:hypothetical protein
MSDRAQLLQRLHRHPDDFAATAELRRLDTDPGRDGARDDHASERLVHNGLSNIARMRAWWSAKGRARPGASH